MALTVTVCDAGAELFNVPLKVSELGVTVNVLVAGATVRVTAAVRVTPPETTEILPL